jgi:hypothetical protein
MNTGKGGPAFPVSNGMLPGVQGMTLRDYFAAKAMAAFITALGYGNGYGTGLPLSVNDNRVAERAYEMADAMLNARNEVSK